MAYDARVSDRNFNFSTYRRNKAVQVSPFCSVFAVLCFVGSPAYTNISDIYIYLLGAAG